MSREKRRMKYNLTRNNRFRDLEFKQIKFIYEFLFSMKWISP